ncbi:AraC family transcriptional regulator [Maribacter sp. HTCC2170]|uniref:AraC family transcriptional regulator n=1 Tax=Maribacter sp. (strain HTCC2170 / KCCM 42371) TaxID=313603 RepID=UPI00006B1A99|nr:AraC family transcriptional regulator [Maribacter sp. HTCC2170]EAR00715.1 transcriptional regulator [Maribacter sp. HTCC2170]
MKLSYESINHTIHTSFNIEHYTHTKSCVTTNWHIHPEYELVYIRNGKGVLQIDSHEIPYDNGALLFIGPNIPHADFGNKDYEDNLEIVIQFKNEFVDDKLTIFPEFKNIKELIKKTNQALVFNKEVKTKFKGYFENFKVGQDAHNLINLIGLLDELGTNSSYETVISKKDLIEHKPSEVIRLETIFEFVNEHYAEPINIVSICTKVGLTKNSFCRFFKKMTHQSFVQFVNEFRIRKAIDLFHQNLFTVSEVMYKCGFNDASYFAKIFKKHTNKTPSEYLENKSNRIKSH